MKLKSIVYGVIVALLLTACGSGGSDSSTSDSSTSDSSTSDSSTTSRVDIQVVSVIALDASGGIVSSTEHKYEGKDELILQVVLKNNGTSTISSSTSLYGYAVNIKNYIGGTSLLGKRVEITDLVNLAAGESTTITIETDIELKNTDTDYTFTFNDASINNTFTEDDYTNNVLDIENIIFEEVDLSLEENTIFYQSKNGSNYSVPDTVTIDNTYDYGHIFEIKNNSSFNFYGDIDLIANGTPFTNVGSDMTISISDLEINSDTSVTPGGAINLSGVSVDTKSYYTIFEINPGDSIDSNSVNNAKIVSITID